MKQQNLEKYEKYKKQIITAIITLFFTGGLRGATQDPVKFFVIWGLLYWGLKLIIYIYDKIKSRGDKKWINKQN
jgi:hypothetical protein